MSGMYYVFMRDSDGTDMLLMFPSRFIAEEFYRDLPTLRTAGKRSKQLFTGLERVGPQFWRCSSASSKELGVSAWHLLGDEKKLAVGTNIDSHRLMKQSLYFSHPGYCDLFPLITNPVQGPDWYNEGLFYIRNRQVPELYWYAERSGMVTVRSSGERTRFRIRAPALRGANMILTRNDDITMTMHSSNVVRRMSGAGAGLEQQGTAGPTATPVYDIRGFSYEAYDPSGAVRTGPDWVPCPLCIEQGTVIRGDRSGRSLKFGHLFTRIGFVQASGPVQGINVAVYYEAYGLGEEWELV